MSFYCGKRSVGIGGVLSLKKASTYFSEYASGFSEPALSHLPAAPSPRNEGLLGQASTSFLLGFLSCARRRAVEIGRQLRLLVEAGAVELGLRGTSCRSSKLAHKAVKRKKLSGRQSLIHG